MNEQTKVEILLRLYEEERAQARQCEEHRTAATNIILIIASALLGLLTQKGFVLESLPVTLLLTVIGIYGVVISQKYYERQQFHLHRARLWRLEIASLHPELRLEQVQAVADTEHKQCFPIIHRIRLYTLWLVLHSIVGLAGFLLTIGILLN